MPSIRIAQSNLFALHSLKGKDTLYWDTDLTGFGVKVTATGGRSFIVQARIKKGLAKKRTRLADCAKLTVKEAREEARKQLASMELGVDPIAERRSVELAHMTLRFALEDRIEVKKLKEHTARDYRAIAANAFPDWMDRPISLISGQMAIDRHRKITDDSGPFQANYALRILSAAFGHARGMHGLQAPNPVTRMREGKLFNKTKGRDDYIEPHDLACVLTTIRKLELAKLTHEKAEQEAARDAELSVPGLRSRIAQKAPSEHPVQPTAMLRYAGAADLIRVLLLTGFRLEEAQSLRWESVDLERKVITLTDNKASRTLRMPMCEALYNLSYRRAASLRRPDGTLPTWVFPTTGEGRYLNLAQDMPGIGKEIGKALGKPYRIYAHKLRHTFATYLRALGHSEWTVAALLNHSRTSSVTTLYAAPMTTAMHRIANEYQTFIERAILERQEPSSDPCEQLLLSGQSSL